MEKRLLDTAEAAEFLRVSKAFLERDRWAGARIPFIQVGPGTVRYRPQDLEAYVATHKKRSTSEKNRSARPSKRRKNK